MLTELKLQDMTLEQKIGFLVCVRGIRNEEDKAFIWEMLRKKAVGGIQVSPSEGCEKLIADINETAGYPILICTGMGTAYPGGPYKAPSLMAVSATGSEETAYELARACAIQAKKAGFNVEWSPILDVAHEGQLCKINRCFSDDLDVISKYGCAMIRGYQDEGMVVTAKHYPGATEYGMDSHMEPTYSDLTMDEVVANLRPYLDAIRQENLSGVMTTHCIFRKIDPDNAATMSPKMMGIIRDLGFDGLIMSDSLAMMSVIQQYGEKEALGLAVAAGNDMVLPNYRLTFQESYEVLMQAYMDGVITDERLNDAVRHVLDAQHKTLKKPSSDTLSEAQLQAIRDVNSKCLCAITEGDTPVPLDEKTDKLFIILRENSYPEFQQRSQELAGEDWFSLENAEKKKQRILEEFPNAKVMFMNEFPCQLETEQACVAMSQAQETIFFCYCRTSSYLASDSITDRVSYIINANRKNISTIVHIGNPFELKKFKGFKRILYGIPGGECEEYAIQALKGKFVPTGKLPVTF